MNDCLEKLFQTIDQKIEKIKTDWEKSVDKLASEIDSACQNIDLHSESLVKAREDLLKRVDESQKTSLATLDKSGFLEFRENIDSRFGLYRISYKNDIDLIKKLKYHNYLTRMTKRVELSLEYSKIEHYKVYVLNKSRFCVMDFSKSELIVFNEALEVIKTIKISGMNSSSNSY